VIQMTNRNAMLQIHSMIGRVIPLIENVVGEFSQDQRNTVGSILFGFWAVQEDMRYPRIDGKLWKDIARPGAK